MSDDEQVVAPVLGTKPRAVVDAEGAIRRRALMLVGAGVGVSTAYWVSAFAAGVLLAPMSWWAIFLVGLVAYFFYPQDRGGRRAREILEHWDHIQVQSALEISGASTDPRLQVAETMASRILQHPESRPNVDHVVASLLERLRQGARDQRIIEVMSGAKDDWPPNLPGPRSLSDLQDYLEARTGRLLGTLADVHAAVVRRDSDAVSGVLAEATEVLAELEAAIEVERLLSDEP